MRRTLFYGWVVVAVTAAVLLVTAGVRAAPGAFLLDMGQEPGWSTGALSFAIAIGLLTYGLSGPISGRLMAVIGIRGVILLSLVLTAGSLIASSFAREIWQLAIFFGLLSGLSSGLVASILGPTVASRWFLKDRGLVTGILGASVSAGQLIFFPLLTGWRWVGWRTGALVLAGIALVLVVPVRSGCGTTRPTSTSSRTVPCQARRSRRLPDPIPVSCVGRSGPRTSGFSRSRSSCAERPPTG